MASWTPRPPGMRSRSTATWAPPCCPRSRRWSRGGTAPTPCSPGCWTGRHCTASWPRSRRSASTWSRSASSHHNANHQNQATAAHRDGHHRRARRNALPEAGAPRPVPACATRSPTISSPRRTQRSCPSPTSPRRWPRSAGGPATPPRNARREASGRQHEASARDAANTEKEVVNVMPDATSTDSTRDRRWLILGVIGLAQLMVVLDITVMNIALPSAQRALGFTTADRQWVVTAYTLAFGSLLLPGGRLADLLGRKVTFLTGLAGFAVVSAVGGASVNFAMLVTARAGQGAFAALLVPSALSLLTTTFTEPTDRGKAFGIYGAIAGAGGAAGLLLGGALTEYLSWRWTLYVNLLFAGVAFTGGALLLKRQPSRVKPRLDVPGALLVSSAVFCLVYGLSNAATHNWRTPSTYGFLTAAVVLVAFALWQGRAAHPLLPPRVVLDRNRGGAYLSMFIGTAGMFGILLFLTYYLQQTLGYSPLVTGFALLPMSGGLIVAANLPTVVLMPRFGPKPLVVFGMLAASGGAAC